MFEQKGLAPNPQYFHLGGEVATLLKLGHIYLGANINTILAFVQQPTGDLKSPAHLY